MPLTDLDCYDAHGIRDLSPLKGMPIVTFHVRNKNVTSIETLAGMPLKELR